MSFRVQSRPYAAALKAEVLGKTSQVEAQNEAQCFCAEAQKVQK